MTTWFNEMNFVINPRQFGGSISWPVDLQSSQQPWSNKTDLIFTRYLKQESQIHFLLWRNYEGNFLCCIWIVYSVITFVSMGIVFSVITMFSHTTTIPSQITYHLTLFLETNFVNNGHRTLLANDDFLCSSELLVEVDFGLCWLKWTLDCVFWNCILVSLHRLSPASCSFL